MIKNFVLNAIVIGYYGKHKFNALKGHKITAQGNALCNRIGVRWRALKGRNKYTFQ